MRMRRVVVTGLGAVTPVGLTAESSWQAVKAGQSGISAIDTFDASEYPTRFAGLIRGFDPLPDAVEFGRELIPALRDPKDLFGELAAKSPSVRAKAA